MSLAFVHLSDIHFGQERGGAIQIHNDVKECLIEDISTISPVLKGARASGIIVTGDIAFGGCASEYQNAAEWLDKVAAASGCPISEIQIVPGNHDIDRNEITEATRMMLDRLVAEGEPALDRFLESEADRDLLFRRFSAFRPFAEAYRCPLNINAEPEERVAELVPGRSIRFIRLNSAIACSSNDEAGMLLLGARQRVLRPNPGEELVVLCHHPVHWFQDSDDAFAYFRNRARILMSGHEHCASVEIEKTDQGSDLMMLAAGATVPPHSEREYGYRYNFIEFDWDPQEDALVVDVRPRVWKDEQKRFDADDVVHGARDPRFVLSCPSFRRIRRQDVEPVHQAETLGASDTVVISTIERSGDLEEETVSNSYRLLVLRFFRDISAAQRLFVLSALDALPANWSGTLSESFQRKAVDRLVREGRMHELESELRKVIAKFGKE